MKRFTLLSFLLCTTLLGWAQKPTITFNYERSSFNMDQPLPAEQYFFVSGDIREAVSMVEIVIKPGKQNRDYVLYQTSWKRSFNDNKQSFLIPVNYNLRGGTEYDITLNYYRQVTDQELRNLQEALYSELDTYIDQSLVLSRRRIRLVKSVSSMVSDMNSIVRAALTYYRNNNNIRFEGFSSIIQDKLKITTNNPLRKDRRNEEEREKQVRELKSMVQAEVANLLNTGFSILANSRFVDDYPTQRAQNMLTLHVGYGGVFFNDKIENLNTGSGGMAGITLPLGKRAFAPRLMSNSAFILGVYFQDFDNDNGVKATSPIFGRPVYAGFGYKVYEFIRISAGVTFLENRADTNNNVTLSDLDDNLYLRPFIGVTADINFWASFAK